MVKFLARKALFLLLFVPALAIADEGMWMLPGLSVNAADMQKLGLRLNTDEIYSSQAPSLKDAIVMFGGGCTGEIISAEGLILTNHHCGEEYIQYHSTVDNDLLTNGFWAGSKSEELPVPGLNVSFLREIKEVTHQILAGVTDLMTEEERRTTISEAIAALEDTVSEATTMTAIIEEMYGGNKYYLFVYKEYTDVRLVAAPPASIGNFGDETDNWMWPRHTADFSMFRVYTDSVGNPSAYSATNIPYKPVRYLKISRSGISEGDFAMIMGYPGSTERFATSFEVEELLKTEHPNRIKVRGLRQSILKEAMDASDKVRIQYTSKYSRSANYYKFSIGQARGLKRLRTADNKRVQEDAFTRWASADSQRFKKYGEALNLIADAVAEREPLMNAGQMLNECLLRGIELFSFARQSNGIFQAFYSGEGKDSILKAEIELFKTEVQEFYKNYSQPTDCKVAKAMVKLYFEEVSARFHPDFYKELTGKYKGNIDTYIDHVFDQSIFANEERLQAFLAHPRLKVLQNDPAFKAAMSAEYLRRDMASQVKPALLKYRHGHRLFVDGLMAMQPAKAWYPDANFTMRLTYGKVIPYSPADAVSYHYQTTLGGVMEKEDPDNREFVVPAKLKELYKNKDFGSYANKGEMPVCFLTDNDITGGNSGSPVLDASGNLIGLAFDGNWEAMTGDIVFDPPIQRTICVDARYLLFLIDKFAGAGNLMDELTIVE